MKWTIALLIVFIFGCTKQNKGTTVIEKSVTAQDTVTLSPSSPSQTVTPKKYSNTRFREVILEKIDDHTFRVHGQAQIFEASFSWAVEDGHNELKKGSEMTDAGAPEWGNFDFTVDVKKQDANSTLTLILFEISAMDGRRQHELSISLP